MRGRIFTSSLFALLGLLVAAEIASAQVRVGVGRGGVGVATPGASFQYGRGYYPGGFYPGGYYPGNYYGRNSWYYGGSPWYNNYPSTSFYYTPRYYSGPSNYITNPGWINYSGDYMNQPTYDSRTNDNQIALRINVPDPQARVLIEGQPTRQMGTVRTYVSPPLQPGNTYSYTVRASWMDNGREMSEEKKLEGQPGQEITFNFTDGLGRTPAAADRRDRPATNDQNIRPAAAGVTDRPHTGKVVQAGDGKLTMTDMDGTNQHTHNVAANATITSDGKPCRLDELQKGFQVKVTMGAEPNTATKIEAQSVAKAAPQPEPEP